MARRRKYANVKPAGFWSRLGVVYKKHRKLCNVIFVLIGLWVLLTWVGSFYRPFSPKVLLSKQNADAAKEYILDFGVAAPAVFMGLQVVQVVVAPIPGQATGFAGGYVFGWERGIIYTMIGLTLGSFLVFVLSRKFGRGFVEKLNGPEAMKDFEGLFLKEQSPSGGIYGKSKQAVRSHGLLTFFIIMLLPGLPDDLVCFIGGLTKIPIWQLMLATIAGRFPGMLVLSMVGDGVSQARSNKIFLIFIGITLILTVLYFWKQQQIEALMKRMAGVKPQAEE
jgi:uncharacterized membrane protein YdjX (TVP38/TMEM64 family)